MVLATQSPPWTQASPQELEACGAMGINRTRTNLTPSPTPDCNNSNLSLKHQEGYPIPGIKTMLLSLYCLSQKVQLSTFNKNITRPARHTGISRTRCRHHSEMLELSDRDFKITMINTLWNNTHAPMKNDFQWPPAELKQLRKGSGNMKIYWQELPTLNHKEKKRLKKKRRKKNRKRTSKSNGTISNNLTYV